MAKREIIKIDLDKCNGCGLCIPNCPEGALQVIDGKARLVSDLFCDGLGACIGHCPQGAISIIKRDAQEYDETKVMRNIVTQGNNVIRAHLEHLRQHKQEKYLKEAEHFLKEQKIDLCQHAGPQKAHAHGPSISACPGSKMIDMRKKETPRAGAPVAGVSRLRQWPVQIALVPPYAPYLQDADLLISADCVPFAYADFHEKLLKGKILLVGCPKLDDLEAYQQKITEILKHNRIKSITYAHMEVPCCFGLVQVIKSAISEAKKEVPFTEVTISISGEKLE
jgi:ferredoxin